ncbi:MAG: hypothetical protein ABL898_04520 [Hyphomicrobiaceae bacterium]
MTVKWIVTAMTLALASTGAQAFVGVGAKSVAPSAIALVSEAPLVDQSSGGSRRSPQASRAPQVNRAPQVQRTPQVQQRAPQIQRAPSAARAPSMFGSGPRSRNVEQPAARPAPSFRPSPVVRAPYGGGSGPRVNRGASRGYAFVRPHRKQRHYGRVVGGVVIGSILAASAYYAYASPPNDGLCWYWTNSDEERGYWDYCDQPDEDEDD